MARETRTLRCWGESYEVSADLADASARIMVDGGQLAFPAQTADVRHSWSELRVAVARAMYEGSDRAAAESAARWVDCYVQD